MKKRCSLLLLVGILLLSLIACGNQTPEIENPSVTVDTTESQTDTESIPSSDDTNGPIGTGIGINPGRVTWAFNKNAFNWNGTGYWWLEKNFDTTAVKQMLVDTICQLAGEKNINKAMDALFKDFNERKTGESKGYTAGEKIVIKLNMNVTGNGDASNKHIGGYYPAPVTMRALLEILVDAGVAPSDITLTDPSRNFPTYVEEMLSEGKLNGVRFAGYRSGLDKADTTKQIIWSRDFEADNWPDYNGYDTTSPSFWPECVTEATYMINLFNLRGHTLAGFTASAKNHFGTVMPAHEVAEGKYEFPLEFRTNPPSYSGLHHYVSALPFYMEPVQLWDLPAREMGTYSVLVDLSSNADAGGKTFLYLCDALAATVHQGSSLANIEKWISEPFGDGTKNNAAWTNSIFASQDPVAIDSVMLDFLLAERDAASAVGVTKWDAVLPEGNTAENSLIEAALADNPPSGTIYQDGYGNPVGSLGVHEHWNNATDKQYSRNLGKEEGIELIRIDY